MPHPTLICYSSRGLGRVHAHLRGALQIVKNLPKHPAKKEKTKQKVAAVTKTPVIKKTTKKRGRPPKAKK